MGVTTQAVLALAATQATMSRHQRNSLPCQSSLTASAWTTNGYIF